jgi:hypothetical protein
MKKAAIRFAVVLLMMAIAIVSGRPLLNSWMMSVPETPFDQTVLPAAPDYSQSKYWAALPFSADSADWLPHNSGYTDQQSGAAVDIFFIHPTAAFYGNSWVAGFDNWLHIYSVDYGIQPQQATPFNGAGQVYAPRYRSIRMSIWTASDKASVIKAKNLAYQDVKKSFEYYLETWNKTASGKRRPFIIASHSQGTLHAIRLIRELIDGKALSEQFIAGYLIGNTIPDMPWFKSIPICGSAGQTGCYVTWNSMLEGGNPHHWVAEKGLAKIDCVNPLSWKTDNVTVMATDNHGSIPMVDYNILFRRLPPLQQNVVGARCGDEGMLWISEKPSVPGYTAALFDGGSYHTYDINLYYDSIRNNAKLRSQKYIELKSQHP